MGQFSSRRWGEVPGRGGNQPSAGPVAGLGLAGGRLRTRSQHPPGRGARGRASPPVAPSSDPASAPLRVKSHRPERNLHPPRLAAVQNRAPTPSRGARSRLNPTSARSRTRTGTSSRKFDFKSKASTIPPSGRPAPPVLARPGRAKRAGTRPKPCGNGIRIRGAHVPDRRDVQGVRMTFR